MCDLERTWRRWGLRGEATQGAEYRLFPSAALQQGFVLLGCCVCLSLSGCGDGSRQAASSAAPPASGRSAAAITVPSPRRSAASTAASLPAVDRSTPEPTAELPQPLDLRQAVDHALARNPDMQLAAARLRQAEAQLGLAQAAFLPALQVELEYLRADAPSIALFKTIDQRAWSPRIDFNDPGEIDNLETAVGLQYNLYNGGRDGIAARQAELGLRSAGAGRATTRNELIAGVMSTWYRVRATAAMITTAEASVDTVSAQLAETRAVFDVGGPVLESDLLSLEARLAEAREQVIRARNARHLAVAALLELLGEEADLLPEIELGADHPVAVTEDPEALLAEALRLRPDLQRAQLAIERAQLDRELAAAAWRPRLDLVGRVYWDDDGLDYRSDETNWMAALRLNWLLYDGGARGHRQDLAQAGLSLARATDRQLLLRVRAELRRSRLQRDEAEARVQTTAVGLAAAEAGLQLVQVRYAAGADTVTRYLEAELMLSRARQRQIQAQADLRQARVDLARASGRLLQEFTP